MKPTLAQQQGETFESINDHGPKPLYYHMAAESNAIFKWKYIEKGTGEWRVKVIKTKKTL